MTTLSLFRHANRARTRILVPVLAFGLVALGVGAAIVHPSLLSLSLLCALVPVLLGIALLEPAHLVYGLACWLVVMSLVRRLIDTAGPVGGLGDPLLLVEPIAMVILVGVAAKKGAFQDRSRLSNTVLFLSVLAIVEALNPLQGGLLVGAAGLLFILVPMLAFWIGRALISERSLRTLFVLIALIALPAAGYGLFQRAYGLPSWDEAWTKAVFANYAALDVNGVIRPFGTFASAAEYAVFLAIAVVIFATGTMRKWLFPFAFGGIVLLGIAIFQEASRGIVVLTVLALAVMLSARRRLSIVTAGLLGAIALVALVFVAKSSGGASVASSGLVGHELGGLSNPFNGKYSTLGYHFAEMVGGFRSAITQPLGLGTGSITEAARVFGGLTAGTEVDPSNFAVAFGLAGLLGYLVLAYSALSKAYSWAVGHRGWWDVAMLGVLVVTFLQWSNGGQYAVAWLPWLVMRWLDRPFSRSGESELLSRQAVA